MQRREYLGLSAWVAISVGSCIEAESGPGAQFMEVQPLGARRAVDSEWELTVLLRNRDGAPRPFHDVTLLVFDEGGNQLAELTIGDLPGPDDQAVVQRDVRTAAFPAIQTVKAEESPCDGARIEITYWVGSEQQRSEGPEYDAIVWETTERECNEPLPPQRVLERIGERGEDGS